MKTASRRFCLWWPIQELARAIDGDGIYLYKGGTSGAANTGNEPYSEFYASQIAQVMGLHAVRYELENWKGILASRCKLFTDIDTAYIPIGRIVQEGGLKACLEYYEKIGPEAYEEIKSMLVFDAGVSTRENMRSTNWKSTKMRLV